MSDEDCGVSILITNLNFYYLCRIILKMYVNTIFKSHCKKRLEIKNDFFNLLLSCPSFFKEKFSALLLLYFETCIKLRKNLLTLLYFCVYFWPFVTIFLSTLLFFKYCALFSWNEKSFHTFLCKILKEANFVSRFCLKGSTWRIDLFLNVTQKTQHLYLFSVLWFITYLFVIYSSEDTLYIKN